MATLVGNTRRQLSRRRRVHSWVQCERSERVAKFLAERHPVPALVKEELGMGERPRQRLRPLPGYHPVRVAVHVHGPHGYSRGVQRGGRGRVHGLKAGE